MKSILVLFLISIVIVSSIPIRTFKEQVLNSKNEVMIELRQQNKTATAVQKCNSEGTTKDVNEMTKCDGGKCPHKDAVCCTDKKTCCEKGYVCYTRQHDNKAFCKKQHQSQSCPAASLTNAVQKLKGEHKSKSHGFLFWGKHKAKVNTPKKTNATATATAAKTKPTPKPSTTSTSNPTPKPTTASTSKATSKPSNNNNNKDAAQTSQQVPPVQPSNPVNSGETSSGTQIHNQNVHQGNQVVTINGKVSAAAAKATPAVPKSTGSSAAPAAPKSTGSSTAPAVPKSTGSSAAPAAPKSTGSSTAPAAPKSTGSSAAPAAPKSTGSSAAPAAPKSTGSSAAPKSTGSSTTPAAPKSTGSSTTPAAPATPAAPKSTGSSTAPAAPATPAAPKSTGSSTAPAAPATPAAPKAGAAAEKSNPASTKKAGQESFSDDRTFEENDTVAGVTFDTAGKPIPYEGNQEPLNANTESNKQSSHKESHLGHDADVLMKEVEEI